MFFRIGMNLKRDSLMNSGEILLCRYENDILLLWLTNAYICIEPLSW